MIIYDSRDGDLHETSFFIARLFVHDRTSPTSVTSGPVQLRIYSGKIECYVAEILEMVDPSTGRTVERNSRNLEPGRVCRVMFVPLKPLYIEVYHDSPRFGRVEVVNKQGKFVATGFVESLEHKN